MDVDRICRGTGFCAPTEDRKIGKQKNRKTGR
jgi:hypothetical protein